MGTEDGQDEAEGLAAAGRFIGGTDAAGRFIGCTGVLGAAHSDRALGCRISPETKSK